LPKYFHPLHNRPRKRKPRRPETQGDPVPTSTVTPMISAHYARLPLAPPASSSICQESPHPDHSRIPG
jgi:hypothetical protein